MLILSTAERLTCCPKLRAQHGELGAENTSSSMQVEEKHPKLRQQVRQKYIQKALQIN